MADHNPQGEARAWFDKLGQPKITSSEIQEFVAWRDDPANDAAYSALELGQQGGRRFVVRPMVERYRVLDSWTGETTAPSGLPQMDLTNEAARRAAAHLNRAVRKGKKG